MVSKSFIVCRLLGGTGRRLYVIATPARPPALLCAAYLPAAGPAITHALLALAA